MNDMNAEFWIYVLAFVPGIILFCAADIRGACAGIAELSVAALHPWPWCYVGMFCLIPLIFVVAKIAVSAAESVCE